MPEKGQIHWYEGLFLRPHHLQIMQKTTADQFVAERRLLWPFSYGLIESKLSIDALENMRVSFDRLRVIMPSGTEINVPQNTELPSLDIKRAFLSGRSLTVSLGVPMWYETRANTDEQTGAASSFSKRIYQVHEIQRYDENNGENPQPILIRRYNARLLLDGEDCSDYEVIPLLRIVHAAGEEVGLPKLDSSFAAPALVLAGSPLVFELVRDLTNQIMASRNELIAQINRGGFSIENMRGIQFEQMLRLQILNRFSARLATMIGVPGSWSPFDVYLELRQLLAELSGLQPDRDFFQVGDYDHDNPAVIFSEMVARIRSMLKGAVKSRFIKTPFSKDDQQGVYLAVLSDEQLKLPNEYYIAIRTKQEHTQLVNLVQDIDRFKCMPQSQSHLRIFGVKLQYEPVPPVELPAQVGLHYFRLLRSENKRAWERIVQDKAIALVWPELKESDYQITLYMTVPDMEVK